MQLLASDVEPTVTLAIDALSELSKANRLCGVEFLKVASQAILGRGKGNVKKVVAMLERIAAADPSSMEDAALAAAAGLEHAAPDVQEIALKFITAKAQPLSAALRARLEGLHEVVAASLKCTARRPVGRNGRHAGQDGGKSRGQGRGQTGKSTARQSARDWRRVP